MRLYSLADATTSVSYGGTTYTPADDGGFDFPPGLQEHMHAVAVGGQRQWETAIERQQRLIREELSRRQSPEALYDAVARLVQAAESSTPALAEAAPARAPARAAKTAAK